MPFRIKSLGLIPVLVAAASAAGLFILSDPASAGTRKEVPTRSTGPSGITMSGLQVPREAVLMDPSGARVAVSYIAKRTGAQYIFNAENGILAILREGDIAQLQIGNSEGWFNQESVQQSISPVRRGSEIYVELGPVADFLGCQSEYPGKPRQTASKSANSGPSETAVPMPSSLEDEMLETSLSEVERANAPSIAKGVSEAGRTGKTVEAVPAARRKSGGQPAVSSPPEKPSGKSLAASVIPAIDPSSLVEEYEGIRYYHITKYTSAGPLSIHAVAVNYRDPRFCFKSVLGKETVLGRETTSRISERWNAIVGINSAFFANDGDPLGVIVDEGKLLSVPIFSRSVIGFSDKGDPMIGNPEFEGRVVLPDGRTISLSGLNQPGASDAVTVFTSEFGNTTQKYSNGVEIVVSRDRVIGMGKHDSVIPPDGYVISATGDKASMLDDVQLWDRVDIGLSLSEEWKSVQAAVGGGPRLLRAGRIDVNGKEERFSSSITDRRHPRTGVGVTGNGFVILAAVDGRQPKLSVGVTCTELAGLMKEMGCIEAINLDGGGSTTLVYRGRIVNSISDKRERPVSSALLVCRTGSDPRFLSAGLGLETSAGSVYR